MDGFDKELMNLCLKANQKIAQRMKFGQIPYSKEFEKDSDDSEKTVSD